MMPTPSRQVDAATPGPPAASVASARGPRLSLDALPQQAPFRFLTEGWRCAEDERAFEGRCAFDGREPFFAGHFPGDPVVPGVLLTEAMAQLCGLGATLLAPTSARPGPFLLVRTEVRFRAVVRPPATVDLAVRLDRSIAGLHEFDVRAEQAGRRVAEGRITLRGPQAEMP